MSVSAQNGPTGLQTKTTKLHQDSNQNDELQVNSNKKPLVKFKNKSKLGFGVPSFDHLKLFDIFFKSNGYSFIFSQERYLLSTEYISFGIGGKIEYYSNKGQQQKIVADVDIENLESSHLEEAPGNVILTLVPYSFSVTTSIHPFGHNSWVTFDLWAGYQELYFQEVRSYSSSSQSLILKQATEIKAKPSRSSSINFINKGWNSNSIIGISVNFLLNPFDYRSVRAMYKTIGISHIYLSPFYEQSQKFSDKLYLAQKDSNNISFNGKKFGLSFTFVSAPK